MKLFPRKQIRWNFYALAFAIPSVYMLLIMALCGYEPFGSYSMLYSDMYHQYYPFFVDFRRSILSGDGLLYNWSVGLGMDYLGLIAYYVASPLNLLSILVPEMWLLEFFSLLVPIKLGLAGLFFAVLLRNLFDRYDFSICVFGGFYGLCAWALGFQWNIMWLDTFALLPLVALGTVKLLKERKVVLYTLTLFLSIFANYYIGLFTCIFVFLLFFAYQLCRWEGWKKFFGDLVLIALYSVLAIGMTAILELPAFMALQNTQSSVNKFPTSFRLNMTDQHNLKGLLETMAKVASNMGGAIKPNFKEGLPNLYCGVGSMILAMLYLLSGDVKWRDKACALFLLLFFNASFIIRQLDYIWHGFHFTNMIPYRFSFLYSFVVLYMAYRVWLKRENIDLWQVLTAVAFTAWILSGSEAMQETSTLEWGSSSYEVPVYPLYNGICLVLYFGILAYGSFRPWISKKAEEEKIAAVNLASVRRRKLAGTIVLGVMTVELAATVISFGLYFPGTNVSNYPKGTEASASVLRYMQEREKKAGTLFYRAETTHSQTLNDGALNGYHGVTTFTSSANVKTTEFMKALGFSAKNTYNRYLFEESSPVANLFLGLKYMVERDDRDRSSSYFTVADPYKGVTLLENQAYLPLGFLAEKELGELEFDTGAHKFQFQNDLFKAASGVEGVFAIQEDPEILGPDVFIQDSNSAGWCKYKSEKNNTELFFLYEATQDGFACVQLDLPKRNSYYVLHNGQELYRETISLAQMVAVGDVKAGDSFGVKVICKADESSTATVTAAVMDAEAFRRGYDVLNASTLELTEFASTRVEGTIHCDRDGLLYTSIPQNGNWSATVDGEEVETTLVGGCMMALELTEGDHRVRFEYRNEAFSLGWKISLASGALFLLLVWKTGQLPQKAKAHKRK